MAILRVVIFFLCLIPMGADATTTEAQVLRFGVISLNHPLVMYRQYLPFTNFLSEKLGVETELVLAKDYESIVSYLGNGKIDIALLAGVSYIETSKVTDIEPLCAVLARDGTPTSRSLFIVREDRADIQNIRDLIGKSFAFGSSHSTSSYLQPLEYLYQKEILVKDFSQWQHLPTQDAVVRAILRGTYDGGSVSLSTAHRFQNAGLKTIASTEPYPGFIIVSATTVPITVRNRLRSLLINIDYQDTKIADSASKWSPLLQHGFAPISPETYAPIRRLMEKLQQQEIYR